MLKKIAVVLLSFVYAVCFFIGCTQEGEPQDDPGSGGGDIITECRHEKVYYVNRVEKCDAIGYSGDKYCRDCNALLEKGTQLAPTGHDLQLTETLLQPTEYTYGIETYTCSRCHEEVERSVPRTHATEDVALILFVGQSNMAGRGTAEEAPTVELGHGYEYVASFEGGVMKELKEPFGAEANNATSGVSETGKSGSLVSSFVESFYAETQMPVVAVSCSKGGTPIEFWDTDGSAYSDALSRLEGARDFIAQDESMDLAHTYVVWCQGETDAENHTSAAEYQAAMQRIFDGFAENGVEQTFVIGIGGYNGTESGVAESMDTIRQTQREFCEENANATYLSGMFEDMSEMNMMKDDWHYTQLAYNTVGEDAGNNLARYLSGETLVYDHFSTIVTPVNGGGAYLEENGVVVINAVSALENSVSANSAPVKYKDNSYEWIKFNGYYEGVTLSPDSPYGSEFNWSDKSAYYEAPALNYTIDFVTPGTYELYVLTSYPDIRGDSFHITLDGKQPMAACQLGPDELKYGGVTWIRYDAAAIEIAEPGEHVITVAGREDGAVLHQIVLVQSDAAENIEFRNGVLLQESNRDELTASFGEYVEIGGKVLIDTADALENSEYACAMAGTDVSDDHRWVKSVDGDGMQVYPDTGKNWSNAGVGPYMSFRVNFTTTGTYYIYALTSHPDMNGDSFFVQIGDSVCSTAADSGRDGEYRWCYSNGNDVNGSKQWKIEVAQPGVQTVRVYAREDGAVIRKIYLSTDQYEKVAAIDPEASVRRDLTGEQPLQERDGIAFIEASVATEQGNREFASATDGSKHSWTKTGESAFETLALTGGNGTAWNADGSASTGSGSIPSLKYTVRFDKTGQYTLYGLTAGGNYYVSQDNGNAQIANGAEVSGWADTGISINVTAAGDYSFTVWPSTDTQEFTAFGFVHEDYRRSSVQTLVIGDSYTDRVYWQNFNAEMADVEGVTAGVNGTKVEFWQSMARGIELYNPANIVIHIGVNDINGGESATSCGNAIVSLIEDLCGRIDGVNIFYVSIENNLAYQSNHTKYEQSNAIVKAYADENADVTYIDTNALMRSEGAMLSNGGYSSDNLHLSEEGYGIWSKLICDTIAAAGESI